MWTRFHCPLCGLRLREVNQGPGNQPTYMCRKDHEWDAMVIDGYYRFTALDPVDNATKAS